MKAQGQYRLHVDNAPLGLISFVAPWYQNMTSCTILFCCCVLTTVAIFPDMKELRADASTFFLSCLVSDAWKSVDPLYRLEHEQTDKRRAASRKTVLTQLTELADAHGQDDYSSNARLRQGMRKRKKQEREREEEAMVRRPDNSDLDDDGAAKIRLLEDGTFQTSQKLYTSQ